MRPDAWCRVGFTCAWAGQPESLPSPPPRAGHCARLQNRNSKYKGNSIVAQGGTCHCASLCTPFLLSPGTAKGVTLLSFPASARGPMPRVWRMISRLCTSSCWRAGLRPEPPGSPGWLPGLLQGLGFSCVSVWSWEVKCPAAEGPFLSSKDMAPSIEGP